MASLYKKRNVWYLSLSINNKRVTRSLNTKDYSIAKQLKPYVESSIIQELTGLVQKSANLTFSELSKRFLNENKHWSKST